VLASTPSPQLGCFFCSLEIPLNRIFYQPADVGAADPPPSVLDDPSGFGSGTGTLGLVVGRRVGGNGGGCLSWVGKGAGAEGGSN